MAYEQVYYDAIGTKSSAGVITPATLTATASANASAVFKTQYMDKMSVKIKYTTNETNSYAKLYILESDDGVNWFSRAIRVTGVDVSDIYTVDPDGTIGIYEKIPNGGTSVADTAYSVCYNVELSGSKYMKLQASEATTGAFGSLYVGLSIINSSR